MRGRADERTPEPGPASQPFPQGSSGTLCAVLIAAIACGGGDTMRTVESNAESAAQSDSEIDARDPNRAEGAVSSDTGVEQAPATDLPDPLAANNGEQPPAEEQTSNAPPSAIEALLSEYRTWRPSTASPVNVSDAIFSLCRAPSLAELAFVDSEHGAEQGKRRMLLDWLNPAARAGFESLDAQGFAPGAAIVKEKLVYLAGAPEPVLVAIGVMLKHEPGFDREQGDWEFAYWEPEPGLLEGRDESTYCAGCHASSPTDFVYLDDSWREPSDEESY
ncbi:MAG: cytochrome P460 family protein [Deltaproteobacteria bacterium]